MRKKLYGIILPLVFMLAFSLPVYAGDVAVIPAENKTVFVEEIDFLASLEEIGEARAEDGDYEYVDEYEDDGGSPFMGFLFSFLGPILTSLGICLFMASLNKSAKHKEAAHEYVNQSEVLVHVSEDNFTHQTTRVRKIKKD